jgi:cytochrome P450
VDNPFWVDSRRYQPDRHASLKAGEARYHLWRFGFGPRQCLGQHVAERMLRAIMIEMVRRYEMSVAEDAAGALQDESWVGLPSVRVTCKPLAPAA